MVGWVAFPFHLRVFRCDPHVKFVLSYRIYCIVIFIPSLTLSLTSNWLNYNTIRIIIITNLIVVVTFHILNPAVLVWIRNNSLNATVTPKSPATFVSNSRFNCCAAVLRPSSYQIKLEFKLFLNWLVDRLVLFVYNGVCNRFAAVLKPFSDHTKSELKLVLS